MLPKSITTAIGMGISEELGGYVTISVAVIIITGVLGNMFAEYICKLFRIKSPISRGLAIGTASHAVGTARAMELGEVEGAMSSLAIVVCGLCTVILELRPFPISGKIKSKRHRNCSVSSQLRVKMHSKSPSVMAF